MTRSIEEMGAFIVEGKIDLPATFSAGAVASRFFIEIRDNKKIMGLRCPQCNRVYVPPRATCKRCFGKLSEWCEVSDKGTLLAYAISHQANAAQPVQPPIVYGIVQLDGADTGIVHMIGEVDCERLHVGLRLQAVFKDKRVGDILDIKHFKPLR
ncbi:MAG: Zn-ribbon domain-containing OB-fold protein [Chloroflexi bacterium]|nr:Zn-ribbon domain-containing OB-fold protein [Chloroflexota bacterium]